MALWKLSDTVEGSEALLAGSAVPMLVTLLAASAAAGGNGSAAAPAVAAATALENIALLGAKEAQAVVEAGAVAPLLAQLAEGALPSSLETRTLRLRLGLRLTRR